MKTFKLAITMVIFGFSIAKADVVLVPDFRVDQDPTPNNVVELTSNFIYGYFAIFYKYSFGGNQRLFGRRIDFNGNPLGNAFRIDSVADSVSKGGGGVAVLGNGNMVFGFSDYRTGVTHAYFRLFDQTDAPLNLEIMVDQGTFASGGAVASLPSGGFVVAYIERAGMDFDVMARIYDSSGNPLGDAFRVDQNPDLSDDCGWGSPPHLSKINN